ncbi:MAG: DegT/DnrJ/EryC1/StrS family aminotransferase [Kiritimatiellia bacterium]
MTSSEDNLIPHSRPRLSEGDIESVRNALRAAHLSRGPETEALERGLSSFTGGYRAVAVSSGTAALYLALVSLNIGAGDKVVIPSYTCNSLYAAVVHAGARPVCADTAHGGPCIAPETVSSVLDKDVKAIIATHAFGYTADIGAIAELGIPVIEDCAQSFGGKYPDGKILGTAGIAGILSFYATKLLPAGEGGACITGDDELARKARALRECDERPLDDKAFNFKMSDIHAALAGNRLKTLEDSLARRADIAARYDEALGPFSFRKASSRNQSACYRYLINLFPEEEKTDSKRVERFISLSRNRGIICRRPVRRALHHSLGGNCTATERLEDSLVSVPIYPSLTDAEINRVCTELPQIIRECVKTI